MRARTIFALKCSSGQLREELLWECKCCSLHGASGGSDFHCSWWSRSGHGLELRNCTFLCKPMKKAALHIQTEKPLPPSTRSPSAPTPDPRPPYPQSLLPHHSMSTHPCALHGPSPRHSWQHIVSGQPKENLSGSYSCTSSLAVGSCHCGAGGEGSNCLRPPSVSMGWSDIVSRGRRL